MGSREVWDVCACACDLSSCAVDWSDDCANAALGVFGVISWDRACGTC